MRIAHLAAEVAPFARTGGLGDVLGALPVAQAQLGHEVAVWMPLYRHARAELARGGHVVHQALDPFQVDVGFSRPQVGLLRTTLPGSQVALFLIGSDPHFDRPQLYAPDPGGHDDGAARYALFVRATFEAMRRLRLVPDLLHAHDWHAALAPMAIAWDAPRDWHFGDTRTVLTVHNLAYQGVYPLGDFVHLGIPREAAPAVEVDGVIDLLMGGLLAADALTAVSPTFAREITTPEGGFGLDPVLRFRAADLSGIVNGIDPAVWSPTVDRYLPRRYDRDRLEGKLECRRSVLARAGMDPDDGSFVVGLIGRLTAQKGYDLFFPVLDELVADGVRFVLLGSGEPELEEEVRAAARRAPGRFFGHVGWNEELSHLIEAGADAFLMPSRFEPCGLNQLYSLAYGTPPIVRRVGGLADTVVAYHGWNEEGATGFGFDAPEPWALRETVRWAARCYRDPRLWTKLARNGMARDFSWRRSAEAYLALYERLRARARRPA